MSHRGRAPRGLSSGSVALLLLLASLSPSLHSFVGVHSWRREVATGTYAAKAAKAGAAVAEDGEDLQKLTVAELKEKLKAKGLPVTGKKADLLQRLQSGQSAPSTGARPQSGQSAQAVAAAAAPAAAAAAPVAVVAAAPPNQENMTELEKMRAKPLREGALLPPDVVRYSKGALASRFRCPTASAERLAEASKLLRTGGYLEEALDYTVVLRNCEHGRHWEWALDFLEDAHKRKVQPDVITYNTVIAALGRGKQWVKALEMLDIMTADGVRPDYETYQALATACSRNKEWQQALAIFAYAKEQISPRKEPEVDAESFNIVQMACASSGAWEAALELLDMSGKTKIRNLGKPGEPRALTSFTVAMFACKEAKKWQACLQILDSMKKEQVKPDQVCLSCAVQALRDGGASKAASALLDDMKKQRMDVNVQEILTDATVAIDTPEVRSPVPLSALIPMAPKEIGLYKWVRNRAKPGDIDSVIQVIERFAEERSWLKIQGDDKRKLLEAAIRPTDRIVEFGCYVGYSSMVMARRLRQLGGQGSVTTCEVDAANAYIARGVIAFAGAEGEVQVRVGCASDWIVTNQLGTIDFLLLDHRGTIYHEDLHAAEPSLSDTAIVWADNVLYPGAPLFLHYVDVQGYGITIHALKEFKRPDLDDWVVVCKPPKEFKPMPKETPAEFRRLSAEIDQISWRSQEGPVDWNSFQDRVKPVLYKWREDTGH